MILEVRLTRRACVLLLWDESSPLLSMLEIDNSSPIGLRLALSS